MRAVLRAMREGTGRDFNVIRATANHPAIFEAFLGLVGRLHRELRSTRPRVSSRTSARRLPTTATTECPTHIVLGRSTGLTEEQLAHLLDDPVPAAVYDEAARVAIVYARRST